MLWNGPYRKYLPHNLFECKDSFRSPVALTIFSVYEIISFNGHPFVVRGCNVIEELARGSYIWFDRIQDKKDHWINSRSMSASVRHSLGVVGDLGGVEVFLHYG